ncbi:NAD-dependent histone deacetylase sir2 [Cryptotrichosporon argae]
MDDISSELLPAESYQIDSDAYSDSDSGLSEDEEETLVQEAEQGYSEAEIAEFLVRLREDGLHKFLRWYLGDGRTLRKLLLGLYVVPPKPLRHPSTPDVLLRPFAQTVLSRILRRRAKLPLYNTVEDALELLARSQRIIVLSGAGISTSCGIPDFRSADGLYAQLRDEGRYELDDPQQMFDIAYFRENPEVFYSFAKQIYPSNFVPSPCHRWIKLLEDRGLLRNYTQNIDTLESQAGVTRVLQCHGSFATASCLRCKTRQPGKSIEEHIMSQTVPRCPSCYAEHEKEVAERRTAKVARKGKGKAKANDWDDSESEDEEAWKGEPGIIKPDITFFGQALDSTFDECLFRDREEVDLLVVIGTSLKVAPVSEVLSHIPHSVPQIFINLTPVTHVKPDICLLGDADTIVQYLSDRLGWLIPPAPLGAGRPPVGQATKIPTDDVAWISRRGAQAHEHMLVSKEAMEAYARARAEAGDLSDSDETEDDDDEGEEEDEDSLLPPTLDGADGVDGVDGLDGFAGTEQVEAAHDADVDEERAADVDEQVPVADAEVDSDEGDAADISEPLAEGKQDRPSKRSRLDGA